MTNTWSLDTGEVSLTPKIGVDEAKQLALGHFQPRLDEDVERRIEHLQAAAAAGEITAEYAAARIESLNQVVLIAAPDFAPDPSLIVYDPMVMGLKGAPSLTWKIRISASIVSIMSVECFVDVNSGRLLFDHSLISLRAFLRFQSSTERYKPIC